MARKRQRRQGWRERLPSGRVVLWAVTALVLGFVIGGLIDTLFGGHGGLLAIVIFTLAYAATGVVLYPVIVLGTRPAISLPRGKSTRRTTRQSDTRQDRARRRTTPRTLVETVERILPARGFHDLSREPGLDDSDVYYRCRNIDGDRFLVWGKRIEDGSPIGVEEIQEFMMRIESSERRSRGLLITTGGLTRSAAFLAEKYEIQVLDGKTLRKSR